MHRRFRPQPAARTAPAFTLPELMIVIGIMILMLAIAVPTFNVLTGARSIEAAQNRIAATLAQTRLSAIGQQQPRGVVFYRDPAAGRIALAIVRIAARSEFATDPGFDAIEVVAGTDPQYLPAGVEIAFRHTTGTEANDYVYRLSDNDVKELRGLVLFDAKGHLLYRPYGIGDGTELARRLKASGDENASDGAPLYSQPAFLLADRSAVEANASNDADLRDYLNDNATVVLVNRYNGTLVPSE